MDKGSKKVKEAEPVLYKEEVPASEQQGK